MPVKLPTRHAPDLPPPESLAPLTELGDRVIDESRAENLDLSHQTIRSLTIRSSLFQSVSLANCEIGSIHLRDVRFEKCDLSNAIMRGFEATRVEFIDCRLVGMRAIECRWNNVLVGNCDVRYAQLNDGQFRISECRNSHLGECDLRNTDLENTIFIQSILNQADLTGAKLRNTDLRGAEIEGLIVHAGDLAGAIFTAPQAMDLARLLGIVIR